MLASIGTLFHSIKSPLEMAVVAYVRVSSADQNNARQIEEISRLNPDKIFRDEFTGSTRDRPQLQRCLEYIREGDTLIVSSVDRLCRNVLDLLTLTQRLTAEGVNVRFLKEGIDTADTSPTSRAMMAMIGVFAEFEREVIRERQREGIEIAKIKGKYKGRSPALKPDQKEAVRAQYANGRRVAQIAKAFGVSRGVIYRALAEDKTS